MKAPQMVVIAGPSGAGKTTFYFNELEPEFPELPFINADFIQHREMKNPDFAASYVASNMATERREHCLQLRQSFIWESSFDEAGGPDFIHRARDAGYRVQVIHMGVESADICIARVAQRVIEGGHSTPAEIIIEQYERGKPYIKQAVLAASSGEIYDNSTDFEEPEDIVTFERGKCISRRENLPEWITHLYTEQLQSLSDDVV